jgi:AraC family transcriptional activator of tynA and feaB
METVFSTDRVHHRDRFDYWHEIACRDIVRHDCQPRCAATFQAAIQKGALGGIELISFENSPMDVIHDRRHIAQAEAEEIFVCRQLHGELLIEQDGCEATLTPGCLALLDPLRDYRARFTECRLLVLKLPRRALEARTGKIRQFTARVLKPVEPESKLVSSFVGMLPTYAGQLRAETESVLEKQTIELIAAALRSGVAGEQRELSSASSLVMMNVRAAIESKLNDPRLDSAGVAEKAGVSVRYANAVLAKQGTSIMRLVQERRLIRCRVALADPSQGKRTISEIAYGWGFSDMTHFARKFKAAYGMSPSDFRRHSETNGSSTW